MEEAVCKDVDFKSMILALLGLWWHGAERLEKKKKEKRKGKNQPQLMKHCIALNAEPKLTQRDDLRETAGTFFTFYCDMIYQSALIID